MGANTHLNQMTFILVQQIMAFVLLKRTVSVASPVPQSHDNGVASRAPSADVFDMHDDTQGVGGGPASAVWSLRAVLLVIRRAWGLGPRQVNPP